MSALAKVPTVIAVLYPGERRRRLLGGSGEPAVFGDELTVEGLFAALARALAAEPAGFRVSCHPELGHPTSASVDFDARVADEEQGFTVTDLVLATP